jgi:beta-phosphoglucomutase-like phosphatase (HAD superfamily)
MARRPHPTRGVRQVTQCRLGWAPVQWPERSSGRRDGVLWLIRDGQGTDDRQIRPNAEAKLAAFGLDEYPDFDVGGYGWGRDSLVPAAQRRAREKYGRPYDTHLTVLVGDTHQDAQAGLLGGALVVGVVTGAETSEQLAEAGAHAVLSDLTNTDLLLATLRGVTD